MTTEYLGYAILCILVPTYSLRVIFSSSWFRGQDSPEDWEEGALLLTHGIFTVIGTPIFAVAFFNSQTILTGPEATFTAVIVAVVGFILGILAFLIGWGA